MNTKLKPEKRYVAFCDVIGFENLIKSQKLILIVNNYFNLILEVHKIASKITIPKLDYFKDYKLKNAIFSDSILVWSESFSKSLDDIWKYDHSFLKIMNFKYTKFKLLFSSISNN